MAALAVALRGVAGLLEEGERLLPFIILVGTPIYLFLLVAYGGCCPFLKKVVVGWQVILGLRPPPPPESVEQPSRQPLLTQALNALQGSDLSPSLSPSAPDVGPIEQRLIDALGSVNRLPEEFKCPITREIMVEPVIAEDGYTYERSAVMAWFQRHRTSPLTNVQLHSLHLVPNFNIRSQIIAAGEEAVTRTAQQAQSLTF
eukprot:TRINITY_DN13340_c0_g1_i1.p1 TRINITY_DN13340_c0_g1~~TRINITY_DN13340_c0_g1_i1.p1  ORF type:complete len:230 (+),score=23.36 TRINITY_DN13340_c0_g1_i1:90-692(+)